MTHGLDKDKPTGCALQRIWSTSYFAWGHRLARWPADGDFNTWWEAAQVDLRNSRARSAYRYMLPAFADLYGVDFDSLDAEQAKVLNDRIGKNFDIDAFLEEIRDMLTREVDLRIEAMNMRRFGDNFKDEKKVSVPKIYPDYCSANVLTMEFIEGAQIKDVIDMDIPGSKKSEYTRIITRSYLKQVYIDGFYHADPHGGNMLVREDGSIAFIDFGAVGSIDDELKKNMLEFYYSVNNRDVEGATEGFLKIGKAKPADVDLRRLKKDMDDLIASAASISSGR